MFSLDQLLDSAKPVFSFTYKGQQFNVWGTNDLPERYQIRLLQSEVEFAELHESINEESDAIAQSLVKLANQQIKLLDSGKEVPKSLILKQRTLENRQSLLNTKLVTPARRAIEAMTKVEPAYFDELPIDAISNLYSQIMNAIGNTGAESSEKKEETTEVTTSAT